MDQPDNLKYRVKRAARRVALTVGPMARGPGECSRILTYHSVGARDHDMNVTPEAFRAQMEWLAEHAQVIPLADAVAGKPGVALTFDDGYRDNLLNAAPVLNALGLVAAVFVCPGRVGGLHEHDSDATAAALLSWDEIRELASMGWTVGSHTLTHGRLSRYPLEQQREEIEGSAKRIADELGDPVYYFAYPYGARPDYSRRTVQLVRRAGYAAALTNRYGPNAAGADRWRLRRIGIDRTDTLESFRDKVTGRLDALRWLDSYPGALARRMAGRLLG